MVAGMHTAAYISPVSIRTDMYWNVAEPISFARETISGNAMVKHSEVVCSMTRANPSRGGKQILIACGTITILIAVAGANPKVTAASR
jgi:hypothetical protein